jgi:hypothetical protein
MRQPRSWAVALTVLLMTASLVFAPREGSAGPAGGRTIMPGEPRPTQELGEPEVPPLGAYRVVYRLLDSVVLVVRTMRIDFAAVLTSVEIGKPDIQRGAREPLRK